MDSQKTQISVLPGGRQIFTLGNPYLCHSDLQTMVPWSDVIGWPYGGMYEGIDGGMDEGIDGGTEERIDAGRDWGIDGRLDRTTEQGAIPTE
jgi:hypothetical protein